MKSERLISDNFECKKCGSCCRWDGFAYITQNEIEKISDHLGKSQASFCDLYVRIADKPRLALSEQDDGSCVFLQESKCKIYPVRPQRCRNFPHFWSRDELFSECRGMMGLSGHAV